MVEPAGDILMNKLQIRIKWDKIGLRISKKRLIILLILLIIIGLIFSVIISQQKWNDYSNTYSRQSNSSQSDIESVILQLSAQPDVSQKDKITQISQLQIKLSNQSKTYCDVDSLIKWQSFIEQNSKTISACLQQKSHVQQLLSASNNIISYLKADQDLSIIISTANSQTNTNNTPDKWNQIESFWRQASTNTTKLVDAYQFSDTKKSALSSIDSIADAWGSLSKANDSKNKQEFTDAETNLDKAYLTLTSISDVSTKQFDVIISELNSLL